MSEVKILQRYKYNGVEFVSIDVLKTHLENQLGLIIDKTMLPPKERLKLLELLVKNKKELVELLTVEIDLGEHVMSPNFINVLDY